MFSNGALITTAGQFLPNSSREFKENIEQINSKEAFETLDSLDPVKFNYKVNKEDFCAGFIAEDVPDLVATKDRKHISSIDIVAVLTKVVKEQQKEIKEQQKTIKRMKKDQQKIINNLIKRIEKVEGGSKK